MKIVTWNINSVRLRINLLKEFANTHMPDVILLQETKTMDAFFPRQECIDAGYPHLAIRGQKSYNGVAILSKHPFDNEWSLNLCNDDARHIAVTINGLDMHNFYVPAGGDEPDTEINPKFAHKLQYISEMHQLFENTDNGKVLIAGDFNIAPFEHDVWSSKQLRNVISHTDIERKALTQLCKAGEFTDIARQFIDMDEKLYSWWSYRNRDWTKSNRGRRLDHIWCGANIAVKEFAVEREMRSQEKPSDHVPVIVTLS